MSQDAFHKKWAAIAAGGREMNLEEKSIYVEKGDVPRTQRQLNLYHYFLFIKERLEKIGARNVAELGCGRGTIGLYCAEYLGLNVTLMDNEEKAIGIAKAAFEAHGKTATFVVGDALHTGFADASFDATLSIGLAEHLDDVEQLFREQLRILRPGGVMISLNIPRKFSVQHLNFYVRAFKKLIGVYKDPLFRDYDRNPYTAAQYAAFATKVGFARPEITHVCPFTIFLPIRRSTDRALTAWRRRVLALRARFMHYPFKTNRVVAQAHFLVASKP